MSLGRRGRNVVLSAVSLLATSGCEPSRPDAEQVSGEPASRETSWVRVRPVSSASLETAPAEVLARADARGELSCPSQGRVVSVLVARGDRVVKGAPIVEVVLPEVVEALGMREAAATRLRAIDARLAKLGALRGEGLVRAGELTELELARADASAGARLAEAKLAAAGLSDGSAVRVGGALRLTSPVDGVITDLDAVVGGACAPASPVLARIASERADRIEARLSSTPPGSALFVFVARSGAEHSVTLVEQAPDAMAGTRRAWFSLAPESALAPGTPGRLEVRLPGDKPAWIVPARAVGLVGGAARLDRRRDGARIDVEVLAMTGSVAVVAGALEASDEVAATLRADAEDAAPPVGSAP
jgi:membrane fusion protein, heavy metal efflux system